MDETDTLPPRPGARMGRPVERPTPSQNSASSPDRADRPDRPKHPDHQHPDHQHPDHHVLRETQDGDRFAWRAKIRRNPVALFWYRIGVAILGGLLMLASALTGWLPGPGGIPLFLAGLAVWASEFAWAKGLMDWFIGFFKWFARVNRRVKTLALAGVTAVGLSVWYVVAIVTGIPAWLPDGLEGALGHLPGL